MKRFLSTLVIMIALASVCLPIGSGEAVYAASQPDVLARTAIIGDSMSTGYGSSTYTGTPAPRTSYGGLLTTEFKNQGRQVKVFAVNGATARRWLNCPGNPYQSGCVTPCPAPAPQPCGALYANQYQELLKFNPTAVLITLGGNELIISRPANTYANDMVQLGKKLYTMIRAAHPSDPPPVTAFVRYYDITQFGFVPPAPGTTCDFMNSQGGCSTAWKRQTWAQYGQALNTSAAPNGISLLDISGDGQPLSQKFVSSHVISDKVHLNDTGHNFYYGKLSDSLRAAAPPPVQNSTKP